MLNKQKQVPIKSETTESGNNLALKAYFSFKMNSYPILVLPMALPPSQNMKRDNIKHMPSVSIRNKHAYTV